MNPAKSKGFSSHVQLKGHPREEQLLRFLVGVAPAALHRKSLVDPSTIDLANEKGPSTPIAVELCAELAAGHVLKILLGRGDVPAAPWGMQFDAYGSRFIRTWRPGGNRNPLQRFVLAMARRQMLRKHPGSPNPVG